MYDFSEGKRTFRVTGLFEGYEGIAATFLLFICCIRVLYQFDLRSVSMIRMRVKAQYQRIPCL